MRDTPRVKQRLRLGRSHVEEPANKCGSSQIQKPTMQILRGYRMSARHTVRMVGLSFLAAVVACCGNTTPAQSSTTLEQRLRNIMNRPEFAHSRFGIKFISAESGDVVYELNSPQLFVPGSTTKLLSAGTALELLGADYRFYTKIYRTGPIQKDGTLQGERGLESLESHSARRHAGV